MIIILLKKTSCALITTLLLLHIFPFFINNAFAVGENWLDEIQFRLPIVIESDLIDELLTNFPMLIILSNSSGISNDDVTAIFDEIEGDSLKIAFTSDDGQTQLYAEITFWDSENEYATIWVKIPSISNITDTTIYLYFDDELDDNTDYIGDDSSDTSTNTVWGGFESVYHLNENSPPTAYDSTSNNYDLEFGTVAGSPNGVVNDATDLERNNDDNLRGGDTFYNEGDFTVECWVNFESVVNYEGVVVQADIPFGNVDTQFDWGIQAYTGGFFTTVSANSGGQYAQSWFIVGSVSTSIWYYVSFVWDSSENTLYTYLNGEYVDEDTNVNFDYIGNERNFYLGHTYSGREFDGLLDEVRIQYSNPNESYFYLTFKSVNDLSNEFSNIEEFTQKYITFYYTNNGTFSIINGSFGYATIVNATTYAIDSWILLLGLPSANCTFIKFTVNSTDYTVNPYNITSISENTTVYASFGTGVSGNSEEADFIIIFAIVIICFSAFIVIMYDKEKRR